MKQSVHQYLHTLEDNIIQIGGLLKALHALDCDDGAHISVTQAMDDQFKLLQQHFYILWNETVGNDD